MTHLEKSIPYTGHIASTQVCQYMAGEFRRGLVGTLLPQTVDEKQKRPAGKPSVRLRYTRQVFQKFHLLFLMRDTEHGVVGDGSVCFYPLNEEHSEGGGGEKTDKGGARPCSFHKLVLPSFLQSYLASLLSETVYRKHLCHVYQQASLFFNIDFALRIQISLNIGNSGSRKPTDYNKYGGAHCNIWAT